MLLLLSIAVYRRGDGQLLRQRMAAEAALLASERPPSRASSAVSSNWRASSGRAGSGASSGWRAHYLDLDVASIMGRQPAGASALPVVAGQLLAGDTAELLQPSSWEVQPASWQESGGSGDLGWQGEEERDIAVGGREQDVGRPLLERVSPTAVLRMGRSTPEEGVSDWGRGPGPLQPHWT